MGPRSVEGVAVDGCFGLEHLRFARPIALFGAVTLSGGGGSGAGRSTREESVTVVGESLKGSYTGLGAVRKR